MLISNKFRRSITPIFVLTTLFLLGGICFGQVETAKNLTGVEEVYLAKDDGSGQAGEAVTSFQTSDVPIYCVVQLDTATGSTVKMNFVAVSVPGVKAEMLVVSTSYTTKNGEDRVNFTGKPRGNWTAGKYRVDVFIDGKLAKNLEFEIRGAGKVVTTSSFVQSPIKPKPRLKPKKN